ncbi:MAG TPA: hypothetical protein VIL48_04695 [Acidimicrobiales bacterium]
MGTAITPPIDEICTMCPRPRSRIPGRAARATRWAPRTFVSS